jgi:uncharacterized protein
MANERSQLDELLQTIADVLFPADDEPRHITLESAGLDGDTPLHVFLWRRDDSSARLLVAHGANVNAIGDMGETPLHVAMRHAAPETIAALLAAGAKADIVSEFGQTPLQVAELHGRLRVFNEAKRQARDL